MRRPIVLVFAIALLLIAIASPLAPLAGILPGGLAVAPVRPPSPTAATAARGARTPPQDDLAAVLTFRGPPAGGLLLVNTTERPDREATWNGERAGSRPLRCT